MNPIRTKQEQRALHREKSKVCKNRFTIAELRELRILHDSYCVVAGLPEFFKEEEREWYERYSPRAAL